MSRVPAGATDVTRYFKLRLTATGLEATGLTITDLDLQYVRSRENPVAKVDAVALAATNTAHTDNRAIEVDATDQPGVYRVDWPDAAFAAGVDEVVLTVKHASCFTEDLRVEIDPLPIPTGTASAGSASTITLASTFSATNDFYNNRLIYLTGGTGAGQAAWISDYVGATNVATIKPNWVTAPDNTTTFAILPAVVPYPLPNAAADAAGGLPISDGGGLDLDARLDAAVSSRASQASLDTLDNIIDTEFPALVVVVDAIKAKTDNLPSDPADASVIAARFDTLDTSVADLPTVAEFEARTLAAADYATNTDLDALITTVGVAGAGLTNINLPNQTMDIVGNITGNLSGSVGSVTAPVTAGTVSDKTGYALSATGLNLVVPADPSAIPVLGTASIVTWIAWFGAWSVNEVQADASELRLRNSADNADLATHAHSDDGTTFQSDEPA